MRALLTLVMRREQGRKWPTEPERSVLVPCSAEAKFDLIEHAEDHPGVSAVVRVGDQALSTGRCSADARLTIRRQAGSRRDSW
jgi:hypothetical protein